MIGVHPQEKDVRIGIVAVCHDCEDIHKELNIKPHRLIGLMQEWHNKHPGHDVEILSPKRFLPRNFDDRQYEKDGRGPWWLDYKPNADIKLAYGSWADYTIGLDVTPLASSDTFTAGRESTAVSNTTNKYIDYLVGGKISVGTTPTDNKNIRIYLYGSVGGTTTYPDVLDGTDSDETITDDELLGVMIPLFADAPTDTTDNQAYWFSPCGIATFFGGVVPENHGLFVAHDTQVALNTTAGNHKLSHLGAYLTG